MNYHTLAGLNNKRLFFVVLEAGKSKSKVSADLISGENPLLGLQVVTDLLYPHMTKRERDQVLWVSPL